MDGDLLEGRVIGRVLVDGVPVDAAEAAISVFDIGLQRGYGCFEALRSYGGVAFRAREHVSRLEASAQKLGLALPGADVVEAWIGAQSALGGDCVVRVLVTGGIDPGHPGVASRVIVFAEPLPPPAASVAVMPLDAPWHPDGASSELTGAKTLSYGPNLAASLAAQRAGYDDALLIGRSGSVLEGPTFSVGWVIDGAVETPSLDLGILASITRGAVLELAGPAGVELRTGRYPLSRLVGADEVFALSTLKEVTPVRAVGDHRWEPGPVTARLGEHFDRLVRSEVAAA